ncbi:MATE family efflux transporter [Butyrivibrio fibrisolvens]|jgi:putative MATE family efflux protein|uniref:Probable multidrug resistance protein NorM n=1 Tax=Butyrivibrio fibrisolvens TaxID=831 RepID=A0A317G4J0_BUTFI|nr:MATE family efflux transporter [Butyrivibrio fibrisolvens]PWT25725.1 MATE family efflux transporter [Butyrivibrio fibrisolvens]PWT27242.1 MATE family efflux transporter [Butyrivibrio fibrisolvens]
MQKYKMVDMTFGSPLKHILVFTIPLVIGNLFQQLYNMVDSIVVGQYVGKTALAAVGACGSMNFLFFSLSFGLSNGVGILVSHRFGAKDDEGIRKTIASSFYVLSIVSVAIMAIAFFLAPVLLRLLDTPSTIINDSIAYIRVTCLGILGITLYNGVAATLRALGDSRTPLYFLIFSSIMNIVLDLVLVLNFGMGVVGVALATIISQYASAIIAYIYAFGRVQYFKDIKGNIRADQDYIKKEIRLGVPLSLQSSMIAISCLVLQGVVNSFGENVVAAFTITSRVEQLVQQPYNSIGTALMTYAGQNIGARKIDRVKKGFWQSAGIVAIFSAVMVAVMFLFGDNISRIFVSDLSVIKMSSMALRITSPFYLALGMIYVPRSLLNGCGDTGFAMINGITEVAGRIIFSNVFLFFGLFGFWSVWVTTSATWALTSIVCMMRFFSGVWKHGIESESGRRRRLKLVVPKAIIR